MLDDELEVLMLLNSLPESWSTLVVTVSNWSPEGFVKMLHATSCLLNEETIRKSMSYSHSEALVVEGRARSKIRTLAIMIKAVANQGGDHFRRRILTATIAMKKDI